jgi:hypothetical protein
MSAKEIKGSEKVLSAPAPEGQLVGSWSLPRAIHVQAGAAHSIFKDNLNRVILVITDHTGKTINYFMPPDAAFLVAKELVQSGEACDQANAAALGHDPNKHLCKADGA